MAEASGTPTRGQDYNSLSYPYTKMNFVVKVGELSGTMAFTEITGVDASVDVIEFRQGNAPSLAPSKIPGLVKHNNVTMKYGLIASSAIREWILGQVSEVRAGSKWSRQNIVVEVIDIINNDSPDKQVEDATSFKGLTWTFKNAFVASYKGADLDAKTSEVAIETLEIAYEALEVTNAAASGS